MIQTEETQKAIKTIHKAIEEGTDAFGLQTCRLKPEYRTEAVYRSIFAEMQDKPVYVTNYRLGSNEGKSDDELARGMITLANAGATLIDVMGDLFCKTPGELTTDAAAVEKQKRLIDTLHELGAEGAVSVPLGRRMPPAPDDRADARMLYVSVRTGA